MSTIISRGCYAVRVVSNELGIASAKTVYHSLIESHLSYGIAFWGWCNQQVFNSTFILQKRAIRYMCKAKCRDHCKPLFISCKILTLISLFILETTCLIHKKYHNLLGIVDHQYSTRQPPAIPLPIPRTTNIKQSLFYESKKLYNHLPQAIKSTDCLKIFKKKSKIFYSVRPITTYRSITTMYFKIYLKMLVF